ncbi:MAG: MFS transporter, partial [Gammaproteobacteria bacterium]
MAENLIKLIKRNLPLLASLGGFLLGYSNGIIGSALLFIKPIFQLSDFSAGLIASIVIIGTMLGIIIASGLTDRWGRRFFISISSLIFMLGFVMSAFAVNSHILLCGRFLAGIGIGIALVVVPLYLVEMAPTKWRGAYIATFQLAITLG